MLKNKEAFFRGNKKRIRMGILASFLAASFGLAIFTPAQAAYPVFDSKNIAEAVKILQQAQKQVAKLTEHIKIATGQLDVLKTQIKNLQDMKKELTGLWSEIERTRAESKALITSTRKEMKGLLAPINDIRGDINKLKDFSKNQWDTTFPVINENEKSATVGNAIDINRTIDGNLENSRRQALMFINAQTERLRLLREELAKLQKMNGEAKGVTDSIQIGNEIKVVESEISATEQEIKSTKNTIDIAEKQAEKTKSENMNKAKQAEAAKHIAEIVKADKGIQYEKDGAVYKRWSANYDRMRNKHRPQWER